MCSSSTTTTTAYPPAARCGRTGRSCDSASAAAGRPLDVEPGALEQLRAHQARARAAARVPRRSRIPRRARERLAALRRELAHADTHVPGPDVGSIDAHRRLQAQLADEIGTLQRQLDEATRSLGEA